MEKISPQRAQRTRSIVTILFLLIASAAFGQSMDSKECGSCHESQYQIWITAKHKTQGVVCSACHGEFHSGSLNGCTTCHTGKHNLNYQQWQFVKDYMVEG